MIWDCFQWSGSYATLCDHSERANPNAHTPPLESAQWRHKPASLRMARYPNPGQATAWLWDQMHRISRAVAVWGPADIDLHKEFATAREHIHRHHAYTWTMPLPGGLATAVGIAGHEPHGAAQS